jgi:hypothetical protein
VSTHDGWESNRARATTFGIITDYASGHRGAALRPGKVQTQGFMEGACLSGIRAADEILADMKSGAL